MYRYMIWAAPKIEGGTVKNAYRSNIRRSNVPLMLRSSHTYPETFGDVCWTSGRHVGSPRATRGRVMRRKPKSHPSRLLASQAPLAHPNALPRSPHQAQPPEPGLTSGRRRHKPDMAGPARERILMRVRTSFLRSSTTTTISKTFRETLQELKWVEEGVSRKCSSYGRFVVESRL